MKILCLVAETPYLSELYAELLKHSDSLDQAVSFVLCFSSKIAEMDKKRHFPPGVVTYNLERMSADGDAMKTLLGLHWSVLFENWDRLQYSRIYRYDYSTAVKHITGSYIKLLSVISIEQPDFVLYEPPASLFGEIAYQICHNLGVAYIGLMQSRIPNRIDLYDAKYTCVNFTKKNLLNQSVSSEEAARFDALNVDFVTKKAVPSYMRDNINQMDRVNLLSYYMERLERLIFYAKNLSAMLRKSCRTPETVETILGAFSGVGGALLRKWRRKQVVRFSVDPEPSTVDYWLFPLHLTPEASVSGQAMVFSDQLSTIRSIAFNIPFPEYLYVKEHPGAVGTRSRRFYKELGRIPNVRLISPYQNTQTLISGAKGVITLTSTVGMEAALAGKLVIVLGEVFYAFHPMCRKIQSINDIKSITAVPVTPLSEFELKHVNRKFWKLYFQHSVRGNLLSMESWTVDNSRELITRLQGFSRRKRRNEI